MKVLSNVTEAQLAELGRIALTAVATTIAREEGNAILAALIDRFGEEWARGRLDYYTAATLSADARADAKWPKPR